MPGQHNRYFFGKCIKSCTYINSINQLVKRTILKTNSGIRVQSRIYGKFVKSFPECGSSCNIGVRMLCIIIFLVNGIECIAINIPNNIGLIDGSADAQTRSCPVIILNCNTAFVFFGKNFMLEANGRPEIDEKICFSGDIPSACGISDNFGRNFGFFRMLNIGNFNIVKQLIQVGLPLSKPKTCAKTISIQ